MFGHTQAAVAVLARLFPCCNFLYVKNHVNSWTLKLCQFEHVNYEQKLSRFIRAEYMI